MKKTLIGCLLAISLFVLGACSKGLEDGVYKDVKHGYELVINGKDVTIDAVLASGEGIIKDDTFEIETKLFGFKSGKQILQYEVKGNTIEVTDEADNLMTFEKTDEKVKRKSVSSQLKTTSSTKKVSRKKKTHSSSKKSSSATSSQKKTTPSVTIPTSLSVSSLAGVWENSVGDRYEITSDGLLKSASRTYRFQGMILEDYSGLYSQTLLNEDGSVVIPNGMDFLFQPAGLTATGVEDKTDSTRDRFYVANNGGRTWFQDRPEWIFYKVSDKSTSTSSGERWNSTKAEQLNQLIINWGNSMGQPGYKAWSGQYALIWQGQTDQMMDITYSSTGVSSSEYTIVATYNYYRDNSLAHRYHFAIRQDGSPVVFYSENGRSYAPVSFAVPAGYEAFICNVTKETENQELLAEFAAIVSK